jgi:hypothetical protein
MYTSSRSEGVDDADAQVNQLWSSWNENSVASIFMDAQRINNVFGSIKMQLDYLREHQMKLQNHMREMASSNAMTESEQAENASEQPDQSLNHNFHHKPLQTIDLKGYVTRDDFLELREELDILRNEVRNKTDIEQKFHKLEQSMSSNYKDLSSKFEGLILRIGNTNLDLATIEGKFSQFQSDSRISLEGIEKLISERFTALEVNDLTFNKENELKLNQMKDLIAVQDLKIKQLENKINNCTDQLNDLNHSFKNFPKNHLDKLHSQLQDLSENKADRNEVSQKADLLITLGKADQNDFLNLHSLVEEIERRLIQNIQDSSDKLKEIEGKLDHRSDRIVSWCLKHLRKELKTLNLEKDDREGTDIGKIRCLVCNQVTTQQMKVTDNVFGGPEFHQTIKGFHRPRSKSPPHTGHEHDNHESNNNNNSDGPHLKRGNSSPPVRERGRETNTSPVHRVGHSRLVSTGQVPHHDMSYYQNPNTAYYEQIDPDFMGDFKYRTASVEQIVTMQQQPGIPGATNNPASANATHNITRLLPSVMKNTQSAPLIQITSVQHPDGATNLPQGNQQNGPMRVIYKDMEQ